MKKIACPAKKALLLKEEAAVLAALPKGKKKLAEAALKKLDHRRMKLTALAAGGGILALGAAGSLARYQAYRRAVARELKKQLAPVNEKLGELEKQNEELRKELKKQR